MDLSRSINVFHADLPSVGVASAYPYFVPFHTKTPDPRELDDFIETQLRQKPFVGISVALLQGGKMTFCKGYGYAAKETKKPVDTETRFAVASVTTVLSPIPLVLKPPKATARLQL